MKKKDYIEKITQLFLQYGIKSVSMDDIAKELGISKKTLYQIYSDKTELVKKSINHILEEMDKIIEEFNNSSLNVIEKEVHQRKKYIDTYLKIKPTYLFDLKKFYPQIFTDFVEHKNKMIIKTTRSFIEEGQDQGFIRQDLDADFISKLSITLAFAVFYPEVSTISEADLTSKHFSNQFFIYHMNGICSEKGRKLFNELIHKDSL
ncbi:TetR/AcrR family transcriptional regulator [Saccharicrinis fermentans]|uniref:HTH-type transcriptional repressor KstR2 n=1 Tax=Saccharicrinis fermentans DSM 9555 = JCM 21142 TaxID=869213 RepID=W7Y348_9BACT|nr:TetR/AcrR family transcriptional regulator [Saccharicrinis fermentans]GAF02427.1 HTH-type transcriptional repressor KstR2 [Saccharicrinis fermentans DSM 9555 = JCM 21142]